MSIQTKQNNKKLETRELITIGVFSALYFIFNMIGGIPFGINPALTFYQPMGSALLSGIIFMFLLAKVPKKGVVITLAIIMAVLRFATGMHWATSVGLIVTGVIAELIAGRRQYKNKVMDMISFGIFALGDIGSFLVYFLNRESWVSSMVAKGTDPTYIETMNASAAPYTLYIIIIGTFVVALFSAFIGAKLLKKQFEKAGVV